MDIEGVVEYWLRTAEEDRRVVDHLTEKGDWVYALFFLHLYLEKLLKAAVVRKTRRHAPYTHDLRLLAERAGLDPSPEQRAFLEELTGYQLEARYPDYRSKLTQQCGEKEVAEATAKAEEVANWLRLRTHP